MICEDRAEAKTTRLKEKIAKLCEEIERLNVLNARMMASEDKQVSLTDPASWIRRIMFIVAHEVTNVGTDRSQLSNMVPYQDGVSGSG